MAFLISTSDDKTFESPEVGHQTDGSITITVTGNRKLRLSAQYWTIIEGAAD
jgi:hypothetical protein